VFGIFTLAQLHHGKFWDTLSQQLQRRGSGYVDRCTFQNKPLSAGDNIILPARFPLYQVEDVLQDELLVKVSEEDMKSVSEIASILKDNDQMCV